MLNKNRLELEVWINEVKIVPTKSGEMVILRACFKGEKKEGEQYPSNVYIDVPFFKDPAQTVKNNVYAKNTYNVVGQLATSDYTKDGFTRTQLKMNWCELIMDKDGAVLCDFRKDKDSAPAKTDSKVSSSNLVDDDSLPF